jgi:hypothetical protein
MNLLEQIIRKTLFEDRTVGKIRNATAEITKDARAFGAVHAYSVLVKGTSNREAILNNVLAVTIANTGTDTDAVKSIGKNSKFATDKFVYICSNPESKNRQIVNVWIVPIAILNKLAKQEPGPDEPFHGFDVVGTAPIIDKYILSSYYKISGSGLDKLKGGSYDVDKPSDKEIEDLTAKEKEYYKLHPEEKPKDDKKTDDNKIDDIKPQDDSSLKQTITYPYTIQKGTSKGNIIYTTADSDPWVYVKDNDLWLTAKKSEFEANFTGGPDPKTITIPKSNTVAYNKLNALIK